MNELEGELNAADTILCINTQDRRILKMKKHRRQKRLKKLRSQLIAKNKL